MSEWTADLALIFAALYAVHWLATSALRAVSPAQPPARRVRIGLTEWECHDMPDGSEVMLPRGGGSLGGHDFKRRAR